VKHRVTEVTGDTERRFYSATGVAEHAMSVSVLLQGQKSIRFDDIQ